jgi:hypothetical protein
LRASQATLAPATPPPSGHLKGCRGPRRTCTPTGESVATSSSPVSSRPISPRR